MSYGHNKFHLMSPLLSFDFWIIPVIIDSILNVCAELENKLLSRFDAASQKKNLAAMAECAMILLQVICLIRVLLQWRALFKIYKYLNHVCKN